MSSLNAWDPWIIFVFVVVFHKISRGKVSRAWIDDVKLFMSECVRNIYGDLDGMQCKFKFFCWDGKYLLFEFSLKFYKTHLPLFKQTPRWMLFDKASEAHWLHCATNAEEMKWYPLRLINDIHIYIRVVGIHSIPTVSNDNTHSQLVGEASEQANK